MKQNNYIWSPNQYKSYYKAVTIYHKIISFKFSLNEYEQNIKSDLAIIQSCLDILKMESDLYDFGKFYEDSDSLRTSLNNMVESLGRMSGLRENKKFASIAISYLLTIKSLV